MSVRQGGKIIADANSDLPIQAGNTGKALFTDGDTSYWKSINNGVLTLQKNGTTIDTFSADSASNKTINITVPTQASDINALPSSTKYAASASLTIDNSTYVVTLQLKDQDNNNIGSAQTIDFPLETMVVSGTYDDATKKIILTLQNGQTIEFSVADLVSGLQTEITSSNMLDADLVDDTTSTHKFVTATDISNWNATALPSQTGHNGEFLTTDGSSTSWAAVDALPSQTGQSGKFLTTDGTDASWATVDALPDQTGQSGKYLTTDGSNASWSGVNADSVKNNNPAVGATNPIYDWVGTLAEYTAQDVATNHPDWMCFITDDAGGVGGIYTAAECDARFSTKTETSTLLATKANVSADNFNDNGKTLISGLGRYSNRFEQLQVIHGASYTAPETGFFTLDAILANEAGNRLYLLLRNKIPYVFNNKAAGMAFGALGTYRQYTWVPVEKGDQIVITAQSTAAAPDFNLRFFYANGVPTESPTFTEVEYIEGTYNTQYIKSGIVTDSSMKIYCKIQNLGNSSNFGWGARNATYDGSQMSISATNQNIVVDWFGATAADRWTISTSVTSSDIFELTIENNIAVLAKNGTNIATHTFTPTATITRELYITGFNNNSVLGSAGATGRLYAFKLWDSNNNLILDMIPAKDGSGVACLYNRATDTLYYNQGTGTYTAGPEI